MITLLLLVRASYMYGVVLHAHPVRGESHIQRNTTGEVATKPSSVVVRGPQVFQSVRRAKDVATEDYMIDRLLLSVTSAFGCI